MQITISIRRSDEWVKAQRLERGENVPEYLPITAEVSSLSKAAREVLLSVTHGEYAKDYRKLEFDNEYRFSPWSSFGSEYVLIDADTATPAELSAAIEAASDRLAIRRDTLAVEKAERDAREAREAAERKEREAKLAEARELLKDEIARLNSKYDDADEDRTTLAEFLSVIPQDAKRGALKALSGAPEKIESLRDKIENAAPSPFYVFRDEDDE